MKTLKNILCMTLLFGMSACIDLDLPPLNVIQNTDVFGSQNGINSYLAVCIVECLWRIFVILLKEVSLMVT